MSADRVACNEVAIPQTRPGISGDAGMICPFHANQGVKMTEHEMLNLITERVDTLGSQTKAARSLGISTGYLGDILHGRKSVSRQLARRLGYEKEVTVTVRVRFLPVNGKKTI